MRCPYCQVELKDDAPKFCASCGKTIASDGQATAPVVSSNEEVLFEGNPAVVPSIGALVIVILTVGIAALYFLWRARGKHYRITTQRVVIETGLFSKRLAQVDLYRVVDYIVERPLAQRIMGTGNIVLRVIEKEGDEVRLDGLSTDVVALYERLRAATEQQKRDKGVRVVDYE